MQRLHYRCYFGWVSRSKTAGVPEIKILSLFVALFSAGLRVLFYAL